MTDIALAWNPETLSADILLDGPDLATEEGLYTAGLISLATDRRADHDDRLPAGSDDRRGWWGDAFAEVAGDKTGSRLWLLKNRTINTETLALVQEYAREALQWMIDDGVVAAIDVVVERKSHEAVAMLTAFHRPDGTTSRFAYIWSAYS